MRKKKEIKAFLDQKYQEYNRKSFIKSDPISIPHRFTRKQDIEIAGFWTAILSWGQRVTIINKANQLMQLMDQAPYDFILNHTEKDREPFLEFKHRTFNNIDTLYFLEWLQQFYQKNESLEEAFIINQDLLAYGIRSQPLLYISLLMFMFTELPYNLSLPLASNPTGKPLWRSQTISGSWTQKILENMIMLCLA